MVFDGVLPKCCPIYTKGFTSDAIKLSQKKEFLALRSFRFTLLWSYIIVVSVISIAFVVVKLKISKKSPFWKVFGLVLPHYGPILLKFSTVALPLVNKNTVWKFFEGFEYLWKRNGPKISTSGPTLTPLFLLKMAKIKKISSSVEKLQPLSYPNMLKRSLYLHSPFREKYDYVL